MSYTFRIGEATVDHNLESCVKDGEDPYCNITAEAPREVEGSPRYDGDEGNWGNDRRPGYGQWAEFVREVGLQNLFPTTENKWPEMNLIPSHPGAALITRKHLEEVRRVRADYLEKDERPAGLDEAYRSWESESKLPQDYVPLLSYNKVRLEWLEFWMAWAIANCKVPTFSNS